VIQEREQLAAVPQQALTQALGRFRQERLTLSEGEESRSLANRVMLSQNTAARSPGAAVTSTFT
jgi:hypothetical protein